MKLTKSLYFAAFLMTPATISAFSSIAPSGNDSSVSKMRGAQEVAPKIVPSSVTANKVTDSIPATERTKSMSPRSVASTSSSWRLVLDIGREPLSSMPFDWARSGCRMPLVIPCDFELSSGGGIDNAVLPRSDTVSFTGENGAVVSPIVGGTWKVENNKSKENNKPQKLSFTLNFPETFARRDVTIEGGSTMTLEGGFYTKSTIDQLNANYYEARDKVWELGKELNDMNKRQEAPKKWNEEKQQWEKRYPTENIMTQIQKRVEMATLQATQNKKNELRPNPKMISSDYGTLPGIVVAANTNGISSGNDDDEKEPVYMQKYGIVKIGNAVAGTWSAEPIKNDNIRPKSYYKY